jgi:hypothetical protein
VLRRIAVGALIAALAACQPSITSTAGSGDPNASGSPAATSAPASLAPASVAPSVAPTPAPTVVPPSPTPAVGTLSILPPGSAIEVRVSELNLRKKPSTGAARVEVLERGQILVVSPYDNVWFGAGPVKKDGYTWYPVMKLQNATPDGQLPALPGRPILIGTEIEIGWIATDNGTTSYVTQLPPRCPVTVDLANVQAMLSAERLACFGGGPIVLEGTYGCPACGAEVLGDFQPIWLNYPQSLDFLSINPPEDVGPVVLRFPPEGPANPAQGSIIRATVHVDDPASAGCSIQIEGAAKVPKATAVLYCREQLVVESYEVLGMDPDFGG